MWDIRSLILPTGPDCLGGLGTSGIPSNPSRARISFWTSFSIFLSSVRFLDEMAKLVSFWVWQSLVGVVTRSDWSGENGWSRKKHISRTSGIHKNCTLDILYGTTKIIEFWDEDISRGLLVYFSEVNRWWLTGRSALKTTWMPIA